MSGADEATRLRLALEKVVWILGCGGEDKYVAAFDPDQDNDREALKVIKEALGD